MNVDWVRAVAVAATALGFGVGEPSGWRAGRQPTGWGCSVESVDLYSRPAGARGNALTAVPPAPLDESVVPLKVGQPFPRVAPHNVLIAPELVPGTEREFCARDAELACPTSAERERIVADLLKRSTRIASQPALSPVARTAVLHVREDLAHGQVPVIQFPTTVGNGPTAGVIRFRDKRSGRWILAIAVAKDFLAARDDELFLDGVLVQEMVHYDDLSFLPDPFRCYESNLEIRGHYAMLKYWESRVNAGETMHPRIQRALSAGLEATSSRAKWYRYLNQVEKTDFRIEDELVSMEFHTLPSLAAGREEDRRYLAEISRLVNSAVGSATYMKRNVARLPSDTINAAARVISAVARMAPRILSRYEQVRGDVAEADGTTKRRAMAAEITAIRRSLAELSALMGVLAADPDFRRKSEFVGVD